MAYQIITEIDEKAVTAATDAAIPTTVRVQFPPAHWLGAVELYLNLTITDSLAGAITIVSTTLGAIPLLDRVKLTLDTKNTVIDVEAQNLDYWQHIDHPGMERFALSTTTSGTADGWPTVLRFDCSQSEANLLGAIPLWLYSNVQLEVTFKALSSIASSTNVTSLTGNLHVLGTLYDQAQPLGQAPASVASMIHQLTDFQQAIPATGINTVLLKGYNGSLLERVLILPQNSSSYTWALFDTVKLKDDLKEIRESLYVDEYQARQRRLYGSSDIPITGLIVIDRRRAGDRDIVALGSSAAPDPRLDLDVPAGTTLTNAIVKVVMETLVPTNHDPRVFAGMS